MSLPERSMLTNAVYLPASKLIFVLTSYGIYFGLSRLLSVEDFGRYGLVVGMISVVNMVFIGGAFQAVSKFISQGVPAKSVIGRAVFLQTVIGVIPALFFALGAPILAALFHDDRLIDPIRLSALIMVCYALYSVPLGVMNGSRRFKMQGLTDGCFSILKFALILMLASFRGLEGAIGGFGLASMVILGMSWVFLTRLPRPDEPGALSLKQMFLFQLTTMLFALMLNLVMNTDLFLIKHLLPYESAARETGLYTACLTLARLPVMVLAAMNLAVFPAVSRAHSQENQETRHRWISESLRWSLMLALPMGIALGVHAQPILAQIYPDSYTSSYPVLRFLALGYIALAFFQTQATLLTAAGRPGYAAGSLALLWVLQILFVKWGIEAEGSRGAALGTLGAFFAAAVLMSVFLSRVFSVRLPLRSFAAMFFAAATASIAAVSVGSLGFHWMIPLSGSLCGYVIVLRVLKQFRFSQVLHFLKPGLSPKRP